MNLRRKELSAQLLLVLLGCRITGLQYQWVLVETLGLVSGRTRGWSLKGPVGCRTTGLQYQWDLFRKFFQWTLVLKVLGLVETSGGNLDTQYLNLDTNEGLLDTKLGVQIPATNLDTFGQKIQLLLATFCPFYCQVVVCFFCQILISINNFGQLQHIPPLLNTC